jgi:hypothetical protein
LERLLQEYALTRGDIDMIVGTGYGRVALSFIDKAVTEITCQVSGHDFYWLKGLGLAGFMLLAGMGFVVNIMGIAPQMKKDAITVLFHITTYMAYGLAVSFIIYKLTKIREIQS